MQLNCLASSIWWQIQELKQVESNYVNYFEYRGYSDKQQGNLWSTSFVFEEETKLFESLVSCYATYLNRVCYPF